MKASKAIIQYIKDKESLSLKPYELFGSWHIGYGHLLHPGSASFPPLTQAEAEDLLTRDITKAEHAVDRLVTVKLNQNKYDALVDFVYNIGSGNFSGSTLLEKINAKAPKKEIKAAFLQWNKAGGSTNTGLTERREYEAALFTGNWLQSFYAENKKAVQWGGAALVIIVIGIILYRRFNK